KERARALAWYAANPEKARAWHAAHLDRAAAWSGFSKARRRFPGCVSKNFNFEATVPIYAKARRLTRTTGIKHEVDHKKALCLGGKHVASNLQVITAAENRKKATAERAEAERRHK